MDKNTILGLVLMVVVVPSCDGRDGELLKRPLFPLTRHRQGREHHGLQHRKFP